MSYNSHKMKKYKLTFGKRKRNPIWKILAYVVVLGGIAAFGFFGMGPLVDMLKKDSPLPSSSVGIASDTSSAVSDVSSVTESETWSGSETPVDAEAMKIANLPVSVAADSTALSQFIKNIVALGYNAAVIELKDEQGLVYYASTAAGDAVSPQTVDAAAVAVALKGAGITPVAKINAFYDSTTTSTDLCVTYLGQKSWLWLDNSRDLGGKSWLNPNSPGAQTYIVSLSLELVAMGYEYIDVAGVMFPDGVGLSKADFGTVTTDNWAVLFDFCGTLKNKLNTQGAKLMLQFDYAAALDSNNYIYGGKNPLEFPSDCYLPELMPTRTARKLTVGTQTVKNPKAERELALSLMVGDLFTKNKEAIPVISGQNDGSAKLTADAVSQETTVLTTAGFGQYFVYDSDGTYQ